MEKRPYDPIASEAKWRSAWAKAGAYTVNLKKAKHPYYGLVMFPYPSGDKLHVGHWYNFAPADSYFRYQRMQGKDVFTPMGFDAFGLPAENYAIKTGIHPDISTKKNVATMIEQLTRMGCMYDWEKMVHTSSSEYYRWTQWLFLQMFGHGLAYKKKGMVNWCPSCQTVLANEQVKEGKCDRCGTDVVQKPLEQWFWKITQYAQRLLDGLKDLEWPSKTKLMQEHWIGRSEGAEVIFDVAHKDLTIPVFTTRVDTIFSAAFVVLAPDHPLVEQLTEEHHRGSVHAYIEDMKKKTEFERTDLSKEKTGVPLGSFAVNPANGKKIPIWIGDFVLAHYGHGAVFGDAHDDRDFIFAKRYNILLTTTIKPDDGRDDGKIRALEECFTGDGILYDSEHFSGLTSTEARKKITAWLEGKGKGRQVVQYRLKDWLVSRQRYWGAPIPVVYDPKGLPHPIPEKHLPWLLPTDVEFKPTGKSPLTESKEFIERTEKIFGKGWRPEFDTMDTFVCSSFYELRYLMEGNKKSFVDRKLEAKWMPVSMYIGGPEHATMHLIYARFVMMALKEFGFVENEEPFKRLVHQGLITNGGAKMSKSKGNVVSPDSFVARHGSDVFRMYLMFMGPFTDGGDWSDTGIKGIDRFVQRVWDMLMSKSAKGVTEDKATLTLIHGTIKRVTESIAGFRFNTAIAALMEFLNGIEKRESISLETAKTFTMLLAPLAPHLSEELWEHLGGKGFVMDQIWPVFDAEHLKSDTMTIVVQVNGKLRASIEVASDAEEAAIIAQAKEEENVKKFLTEPIRKEIYVKGRLVSFVV